MDFQPTKWAKRWKKPICDQTLPNIFVESANSELSEGKEFPRNCSNHLDGMGVRHSLQTPRMEHTFIIKTTTCCICSIVCLYYFLQLENNGKMMKERMPWWHDEWTVKMTISFVETSRLFYFFSLIKPQIFATIWVPEKLHRPTLGPMLI